MSYEDWVEKYQPEMSNDYPGDENLRQYPTWTSVPEGTDPHNIWAVMEGEYDDPADQVWTILPGYHLVNILFFVVTANPWDDADPPIEVTYD